MQIARRFIMVVSSGHGLRVVALCYWGKQPQIARRLITVVSRWSWVASGGAVLLGNATADG